MRPTRFMKSHIPLYGALNWIFERLPARPFIIAIVCHSSGNAFLPEHEDVPVRSTLFSPHLTYSEIATGITALAQLLKVFLHVRVSQDCRSRMTLFAFIITAIAKAGSL